MALASSSSQLLWKPCSNRSSPSWSHHPRTIPFTVSATPKKLSSSSSSRTGRFDSKNRKTGPVTIKEEEVTAEIEGSSAVAVDDGFVMPELPGAKPDFFEGPQWDAFGFFIQYMWAFGVLFALLVALLWQHITKGRQILRILLCTRNQSNLENFLKSQMHLFSS
ncbi:hypothetical protein ACS0TY_024317 [Phlomoides rotata]